MVRIKLPGGRLTPPQAVAIAEVLDTYSQHDKAHITTRKDIQLHYVPTDKTAATMRALGEAGLTTREACGNTVRNVTACPLAGVCPHEHVDVTPHLQGIVRRFLRHPLTQHLPRKFKISLSGCETDCAQGMMHCLGIVAVNRDGKHGFKVVAGGGLGHKPHEAIVIEEFLEERDLLPCVEALLSMHNRYSDRKRRAKARIKFLVDRFGPEGFVEKYKEEFKRTQLAYIDKPFPRGDWTQGQPDSKCGAGAPRAVYPQKQKGYCVVPVSVSIGDLTAPQLTGIAKLMTDKGLNDLRTTQDQNLMIMNVPENDVDYVKKALAQLNLALPVAGDDVVACPGTSTCRLGITSSKIIGAKLDGSNSDLRIRASGCHNGCAQPETGEIGIYGEGKRMHGKLIPHYQMYFGGDARGHGGLAFKGPSVPAARIEAAIELVEKSYQQDREQDETFFHWSRRQGAEGLAKLLEGLTAVSAEEVASVLHDHGDESAFKVLQLGGGECAGAAQDLVASSFSEAAYEKDCRNAFASQRKHPEAIECIEQIGRLVGQSVLFILGHKFEGDLSDLVSDLKTKSEESAELGSALDQILSAADRLKSSFDEAEYMALAAQCDQWMTAAARFCQTRDSQLDLSTSVTAMAANPAQSRQPLIDLSTYACPLYYVKAKNEMSKLAPDSVVDLLLDSEDSANQLAESLVKDGHEVLESARHGDLWRLRLRTAAAKRAAAN